MSDLGFNKIAAAVLTTGLVVLGLHELSTGIYTSAPPAKPGYAIAVAEDTSGGGAAVADLPPDWGTVLPAFRDHCLLGRQAVWPKGRFSCLAGFMEPGESIEAACAREVKEEAGLTVVQVRYHSSQPWPFPSNLMIGLIVEVSDRNAAPDQTELEEVRWFSRDEMKRLLNGEIEGLGAPPPFAVAHQLMKAWAEAG